MRIWLASFSLVYSTTLAVAQDESVNKVIVPFVTKHCVACHGPEKKKADLVLHPFKDEASILKARKIWMNVLGQIHTGEMPPAGKPRPTIAENEQFAKAVTAIFERHDRTAKRDPGVVTMRRLNRTEYANTIRDLIGVETPTTDDFPGDDVGHGFDNIGDVLTISPLHMERYLAAAETIMRPAILVGAIPKPTVRNVSGRYLEPQPKDKKENVRVQYDKSTLYGNFRVTPGGDCEILVKMAARPAGDDPVKVAILLDNVTIKTVEIAGAKTLPAETYKIPMTIKAGDHRVSVVVLNEYKDPQDSKIRRAALIESISVNGPLETRPRSHHMLLDGADKREGDDKTRFVLERFATRAYRRPATVPEVDRLIGIVKNAQKAKETWEASVSLAMQAVLASPKFLFRVELDARPDSKDAHPIDDYQLASRLSYFLWSTMPDDELFRLAAKKQLHPNIKAQVKRMLADPKAQALVENFAVQWLQLRPLRSATPDIKLFPEFSDSLRSDMLKETELFIGAVISEDRSILDLIDSKFTFLNERLARLYGIRDTNGNPAYTKAINPAGKPITGDNFVRVNLDGTKRGGLLTQASILTVTSNPTRTSPVKRGRWVLEQILGTPPPPPPPNVPELAEDSNAQTKGSLRQRMEQHRANAACAGCHARMDPIGFAFENFTAIGKFREKDGEFPIDPAGELPGGQKFRGPEEFKTILKGKKDLFSRCLAEKMLTYAIGRGTEFYDKPAIDAILTDLEKNDFRFSALISAIATSDPFRLRRGKDQE
jgi:hypothetical protein